MVGAGGAAGPCAPLELRGTGVGGAGPCSPLELRGGKPLDLRTQGSSASSSSSLDSRGKKRWSEGSCVGVACEGVVTAQREPFNQPCEPAGATFDETLAQLSMVDRQVLCFSAGHNLCAVRWLFMLRASPDAKDSAGTTCLHVACRSGGTEILQELLRMRAKITALDLASWTPLHVAAFVGRRDAVWHLLRAGAQPWVRTLRSQLACDLCGDTWIQSVLSESGIASGLLDSANEPLPSADFAAADLKYEPFFVPRDPVLFVPPWEKQFETLGKEFFSSRPGPALAFLVATGCVRDYPVDLASFLRRNHADPAQIGRFLGEAFSLAAILRVEYINSVNLYDTGVVGCLKLVFSEMSPPADLQKLDRFAYSVAQIWWRQHEPSDTPKGPDEDDRRELLDNIMEISGLELQEAVGTMEALHQLLFSTLMLHFGISAPVPIPSRPSLEDWLAINHGMRGNNVDVPWNVQKQVYEAVRDGKAEELEVVKPCRPRTQGMEQCKPQLSPAMRNLSSVNGWVGLKGHDFRGSFSEGNGTDQGLTPRALASLLSEDGGGAAASEKHLPASTKTEGLSWLSLCGELLLLFSVPPFQGEGAPYGFVPLGVSGQGRKVLERVDFQSHTLVVAGPVTLVLLLQDARWRTLELPRLELNVEPDEFDTWTIAFSECSQEHSAHVHGTSSSARET